MKVNWIHHIIVIAVCMLTSLTALPNDGRSEPRNCTSYFTPHTYYLRSEKSCLMIFSEKETWDNAKDICSLSFSFLGSKFQFNSTLHLTLVDKGIDLLWVGIRRRADFFVTENPTKLFRERTYSSSSGDWGYRWSVNEPGLNDCVAFNVTTGLFHTLNCKYRLPFVCDEEGEEVDSDAIKDLSCPEGWMLSVSLSTSNRTCISNKYKPHSYDEANTICHASEGRLATSEEYHILRARKPTRKRKYWVEDKGLNLSDLNAGTCPFTTIRGAANKPMPKNCSHELPFICVKNFEFQRIKVLVSGSDTMEDDTTESESTSSSAINDMQICFVKAEDAESDVTREPFYQWYKDDIPISFRLYVLRLSFAGDALKRNRFESNNLTRQGSYHCEARFAGTTKSYSSPKLNLFYADVATYSIDIHGIQPQSIVDYSQKEFFEYISDFNDKTMDGVMEKLKSRYPRAEWDFKSTSVKDAAATMRIVVYIYRTDVDNFDDKLVCEEVQETLEDHYSIPADMNTSHISFNAHCEDFPVTLAYRLTKSLNAVKLKIRQLEETQIEILEKLRILEISGNNEPLPTDQKFDSDFLFILKAMQQMNHLEKGMKDKPIKENSDETFETRERNKLDGFSPTQNRIYLGSESRRKFGFLGPKGKIPFLKQKGIMSEEEKKYYYFPGEDREEPFSGRHPTYLENEP